MSDGERAILQMYAVSEASLAPCINDLKEADERVAEARRKAEEELARVVKRRKKRTCVSCRNDDEQYFEEDDARGQVTCTRCGTCVVDSAVNDTEWVRQ